MHSEQRSRESSATTDHGSDSPIRKDTLREELVEKGGKRKERRRKKKEGRVLDRSASFFINSSFITFTNDSSFSQCCRNRQSIPET